MLDLATAGGAAALGRPDLGALAPGRWADIVRLDLDDPGFVPVLSDGDLAAHAVWSASRAAVRDVWVGGRQVVRDGECLTIDVAEAAAGCRPRRPGWRGDGAPTDPEWTGLVEELADAGRTSVRAGLVLASGGNLSARGRAAPSPL